MAVAWKSYSLVLGFSFILTLFLFFYQHMPKHCRSFCLERKDSSNSTVAKNVDGQDQATNLNQSRPEYFVTQKPPVKFIAEPFFVKNDTCLYSQCISSKEAPAWTMVTFVKSSMRNFHRRNLLRRTWASLSYVDGARFLVVFVIGSTTNRNWNLLLNEEIDRNGDIIIYDGPDDYRNIGLKTLAGMSWAQKNLPENFLYSSADDDFIINVASLKHDVDHAFDLQKDKKWPEFPILCSFIYGGREVPIRNKDSKWYLEEAKYKWTAFPPYCHGGFYTTSVKVIRQLYDESRLEAPLPLDDVWITGILRRKIGMPDEMVYMAKSSSAKHFNGFRGKEQNTVRDFMKKEWSDIFDTFKDSLAVCTC